MRCPICSGKTKVSNSRYQEPFRKRWYICKDCGEREVTFETSIVDLLDLLDGKFSQEHVDEIADVLETSLRIDNKEPVFTQEELDRAKENGIYYKLAFERFINAGWDKEKALTYPVRRYRKKAVKV